MPPKRKSETDLDNIGSTLLLKRIDIVQSIISRMAQNSFLLKGWAVTLVVGVLLLKQTSEKAILGFVPTILFWCLDAYYLKIEREYRALSSKLMTATGENTSELLAIGLSQFKQGPKGFFHALGAPTVIFFHVALIAVLLLYMRLF